MFSMFAYYANNDISLNATALSQGVYIGWSRPALPLLFLFFFILTLFG